MTRFATTLVGVSDAGDVISDAMESLLRGGQLLKAHNPSALMHRAVFNKARSMQRSFFRRRARKRRFEQELVVTHPELRPDVITAVIKLSPRQRACIYLSCCEDLAPTQVAQWLNIGGAASNVTWPEHRYISGSVPTSFR